jgi:DNA-binding transcriptional LysR family regulator
VELRQLEHFVAVAEERHFTRAAQRMNIVQSGLSASIKSLERELGTSLFARTTRRVELTEAGRALLAEARRVLAAAIVARDAVGQVEGLLRGTLSVGILQVSPAVNAPALIARFHIEHPSVDIRLIQAGSTEMLDELRDGRLDVAFVSLAGAAPEDMIGVELAREPMLVACARTHPLADRSSISLAALREEPFADFHPGWGARIINDQAFSAAGLRRHVAFEVNELHTLLELVEQGLAVALLPLPVAQIRPSLQFVPLSGKPPIWAVELVAPKHLPLSAAARAFFAIVTGESPVQERPDAPAVGGSVSPGH